MAHTTRGKIKFIGNAAKNCAMGCTMRVAFACNPIKTPKGTHTIELTMMAANTRIAVKTPSYVTEKISEIFTFDKINRNNTNKANKTKIVNTIFQVKTIHQRNFLLNVD